MNDDAARGVSLAARKLASNDPPPGWENSWNNFTAGMETNSSSPSASAPNGTTSSPSSSSSTTNNNGAQTPSSYGELGLAPSTPLAGILIAIVAAAVVILTSASIVAILRYTVTRSRRRRRLEQYSQDRRRRRSSSDVPRPLQEDISVSVHSDHEHYDHDCEFRQSKLPTIVLQPDGQTVDFAVEEVKVSPDQKEDEVDGTTRRNNSHRPFLVTVEVIEGSPSRDSTMDERGSDSIKYDSRQDVP